MCQNIVSDSIITEIVTRELYNIDL